MADGMWGPRTLFAIAMFGKTPAEIKELLYRERQARLDLEERYSQLAQDLTIAIRTREEAWDIGAELAREYWSSKRGHWEDDPRREGVRNWISDPEPINPYRKAEADASDS
jgi:hypothetical protein